MEDVLNKIKDKLITHNMFRIQSSDFIMRESLFSPNGYQKNVKVIQKYSKHKYDKRKQKSRL